MEKFERKKTRKRINGKNVKHCISFHFCLFIHSLFSRTQFSYIKFVCLSFSIANIYNTYHIFRKDNMWTWQVFCLVRVKIFAIYELSNWEHNWIRFDIIKKQTWLYLVVCTWSCCIWLRMYSALGRSLRYNKYTMFIII